MTDLNFGCLDVGFDDSIIQRLHAFIENVNGSRCFVHRRREVIDFFAVRLPKGFDRSNYQTHDLHNQMETKGYDQAREKRR